MEECAELLIIDILKMKKDLIEKWKKRPMSWSQIHQFKSYSKEDWYKKYILGEQTPTNKELAFGSAVGKRLETDPTYIPEIPREKVMEYEFAVKMGDISLVGYADSYGEDTLTLREYKTGKTEWNQKRVDEHGQITLYLLMLYLKHKIKPEDVTCTLHWLPTEEKGDFSLGFKVPFKVHHFTTKRTTKDCLLMGAEIVNLRKEMEAYVLAHE